MIRWFLEDAAELAALGLFLSMIILWSQGITVQ